jgi:rifampicin phosphotransferase
MELLVNFADVESGMLEAVGGKGLNLGLLRAAGLPVPDGFCVSTAAYRAVVDHQLDSLSADLAAAEPGQLGPLATRARELITSSALPPQIAAAVSERYEALGSDVAVAVRSSATAEDLPDASFAGQQDTYLNVIGSAAVLDAVRRCWASLWNDRAVSYRNANGIDHATVALAVVIQRMVDAQVAGVMFTADPVTGHRDRTVIDASPGLGEAVVSGAVNPDRFVAVSSSGEIVERRLGDKKVTIRSRAGGGTERVTVSGQGERACLNDQQIGSLVRLGLRVQTHYGSPQDTEWVIGIDEQLWLTQARPITTLYPVPPSRRAGTRVFFCVTLAQGLTRPITPMGLAAFRMIGSAVTTVAGHPPADVYAGPGGLAAAGQRLFVDITPIVQHGRARRVAHRLVGVMEARTQAVLTTLFADPRFPITASASAAPIVARIFWVSKLPLRVAVALLNPALTHRGIARVERRLRARLAVPESATPGQRLDFVERRLGTDTFLLMPRTIGYALAGFAAFGLARKLLGRNARPEELQTVLRGLPHNVTTEMDLELWALTERVRSDPPSSAAFAEETAAGLDRRFRAAQLPELTQRGLTDFLSRYGHRAVAEIDLGVPRWSEEPEHLLGVISNYLRLDNLDLAPDRMFMRGRAEAEAAVAELTRRATDLGPLRGRLVALALRRTRQLVGLRETPKFLLVLSLAALRHQLSLVGAAAAQLGAIEDADDIFWLDLHEARQALNAEPLKDVVRVRRSAYERERRRRHIPRILLSDGSEPEASASAAATGGELTGSPASAGVVTGAARVVLEPLGAQIKPGEILIAPSTDPGWTPLFLTAGGLVMEMGGSNSHGAVVAREYGIPAVVGVPGATAVIETGQVVTVDGAAGRVRIESKPVS